jgi:hypothetical protein
LSLYRHGHTAFLPQKPQPWLKLSAGIEREFSIASTPTLGGV